MIIVHRHRHRPRGTTATTATATTTATDRLSPSRAHHLEFHPGQVYYCCLSLFYDYRCHHCDHPRRYHSYHLRDPASRTLSSCDCRVFVIDRGHTGEGKVMMSMVAIVVMTMVVVDRSIAPCRRSLPPRLRSYTSLSKRIPREGQVL